MRDTQEKMVKCSCDCETNLRYRQYADGTRIVLAMEDRHGEAASMVLDKQALSDLIYKLQHIKHEMS